ncbi:MAG: polysaccharide deacetylase family protein [Mogibacterium sp.]|nr:polysaccharide deacetylase family protein [Mogibacterium sp.]
MSDNHYDDARRQAAAENLARRKQELRKKKKRKQALIRLMVLGLLVVFVLGFAIVKINKMVHSERNSKAKDAVEESKAEEKDAIIIGIKGSPVQMVLQDEPYIENGAFAIDTEEGAIDESDIKIKGSVDTSKPGDYKIEYSVRKGWSKFEAERIVRVMTEKEYGKKAGNVPVLMYHWVYTKDDIPKELDGNWILDTDLDKQLAYLEENEFYYPGWKELRAWIDDEISLPEKCAVLTFDDGKKEFLKYGVPLLEKHHVPATSFMICWKDNSGAKKVKQYASPYVDFESHSFAMHQKVDNVPGHKGIMAAMTKEEIAEDLVKAKEIVGNNDAFAYPYGDYTDDMVDAVRDQGILCSFTTEYDRVRKGADPMKLPRIRVHGEASFDTWKNSVY